MSQVAPQNVNADPTDAQRSFAHRLSNEKELTTDQRTWLDSALADPGLTRGRLSAIIDRLLKLPSIPADDHAPTEGTKIEVPDGRYALENDDGLVLFYRVDKPTEGRWAGRTFLKPVYGGPGTLRYGDNIYGPARTAILKRIAADPRAASLRFGLEIGCCGVCASPLTNEESRKLGIGPVCRAKQGW